MRVFKTKPFVRFARREGIDDAALCDAVRRAGQGGVDADLGGGVIKQRIARPGQGRARGLRSIVLFRRAERAFFVHGFAKSRRATLRPDERQAPQTLADTLLGLDDAELAAAMANGTIREVDYHGKAIQE